ncbi:WecB/TagA/CpsF family glycosyltransferase [Bosea sp. BK604]|uniref:WecB/TagA/CpsF family glycosyltransferase n=1 Tax=Bosea sp. BK604 TaxID=2512180 RepID=UPI00104C0BD4|nr:WecB/TagA/CpsF family glycosyltransferase [Bosea sp. BK604]TCR62601.1 N-acetylglucosaminyldiphosphoundecaprenol N-acetyl-beta-D-mannosaminyltransferase [Bosea sp. BK604]
MTAKSARQEPARVDILGVRVSAINLPLALETIQSWIAERKQRYVCITGAHGVMESQHDETLRTIHNQAGLVTPDGMPLVWMSRLLGHSRTRRVYGPDLMRALSALSAKQGYRQFYYGGDVGVADTLAARLCETYPGLVVAGTLSPPFRPLSSDEDAGIVEQINAARPDIVWVGLSTPKQEYWMASHAGRVEAPVMIGVGAAFDFLAGRKAQAPLWMQRNGLEWLFRLCQEPRRLFRRYVWIVPAFLASAGGMLIRRASSAFWLRTVQRLRHLKTG